MQPQRAFVSRRQFLGRCSATAAFALVPRWSHALDVPRPAKRLGVALVGLGSYSTLHLGPALRLTKHCRLAGVVTGSPAKGKEWAGAHGFSEKNIFVYDTMAKIAGCRDIDIVYVVTPNGLHAEHCIAAAKAGKHVICEKPMATSVAQCDAIIAASHKAGVQLSIGYRLHFEPHHLEFARLARERTFGPFLHMSGANGFRMGTPEAAFSGWRTNKKLAGGGPLMDMGVYVVQAACMAKAEAPPIAVTAKFDPAARPELFSEVEESVKWTMEFADGATGNGHATYDETVSHFRAEAVHGWAELGEPAFSYGEPILTTSRGSVNFPEFNQQVGQLDGIAQCLASGRPSPVPGEMGRRDIAIIEAIYTAAKNDQRVEIKA